jgi:cellulose synthase/poly-beta-1,6-N-acetylglucosamine synthase-like glycosyltransferase
MAAQPARRLQPKIPTPASMPLRGRISDLPSISVIIPCLNEEGVVDGLIDDLLDNDYPHFEIIVCDSGSSDGTASS